ncbi:MAG: ester cyclase [Actinomycetes bacterium]
MNSKELASRILELTDAQDWLGREALLTPDCEFMTPAGIAQGPAAVTAYSQPFARAFSVSRHNVDLIVATDDVVVVEGVWVGTHDGPLTTPDGDIPATGRPVSLPFTAIFQVSDDLAGSVHIYFDQLSFMAQLGLIPQPQAA